MATKAVKKKSEAKVPSAKGTRMPVASAKDSSKGANRSAGSNPVREVRLKLGLTRKAFSRLTGYSERAVAAWEAGATPDEPGLRRIRETERFQSRLAEVVGSEVIPEWLDSPNEAFGGLKPIEVIERGEIDRLWNMIFYLESGVPG